MPKYKTYHGRNRFGLVKIVLLVLALGGAAALCIFVLPEYIELTEGGISINLPWLASPSKENPSPPSDAASSPSMTLVISSPPGTDGPSPSQPPEVSPTPAPSAEVRALFIPFRAVSEPETLERCRNFALARGLNGVIIEYKDDQNESAERLVTPEQAGEIQTIFHGAGLELTALISAGVDNYRPRTATYSAWGVKHTSGQNFLDQNRNRWLNFYKPEVRAYAAGLAKEALDAGFDRALLTNIGFPTGGVQNVAYGADAAETGPVNAVSLFLDALRDVCGPGACLDAVIHDRTAAEGVFETAGQDLERLSECFERLYIFLPGDADGFDTPFIPIIDTGDARFAEKLDAAGCGYVIYAGDGEY